MLQETATFRVSAGTTLLTAARDRWDALAEARADPFLTHAWLTAWAQARARSPVVCAALIDARGELLAGALLQRQPRALLAPTDVHSGAWDVVAVGPEERQRLWEEIAALGARRLALHGLREGAPETAVAQAALQAAGYSLLPPLRATASSPYVALPSSFDELLASRSRGLRSQWRRKQQRVQRAGAARLRLVTGGSTLERDLDRFLRLEASGWKGRNGTAILLERGAERLYRGFAREAAERGWLRLALLELDGELVAGDLACAIGGVGHLLKTTFDERRADLSPGFVLRGEALRMAVEEGLRGYDMLGGPEQYKLQWTDELRSRQALLAFRGPAGRFAKRAWQAVGHPLGRRAVAYLHDHAGAEHRGGAPARAGTSSVG